MRSGSDAATYSGGETTSRIQPTSTSAPRHVYPCSRIRYSPGPKAELLTETRRSRFESGTRRCRCSTRPASTLSIVSANDLNSE